MITLNGNKYRLVHLDTCILSELAKQREEVSKNIISKIFASDSIPCYSVESMKELKFAPKLYDSFFNLFSLLPSLTIRDHTQLFEEEKSKYDSCEKVNPILTTIFNNPINKDNFNFRDYVDQFLTNSFLQKYKEDCLTTLQSLLKLKKNFLPSKKKYLQKDIEFFLYSVVITQIGLRDMNWAQSMIQSNTVIEIKKFLSLCMATYLVFYKFYTNNRVPKISDIPDLLIASSYPYMDEIITEKNQAEMIRQIQKKHNFCTHLKCYTINDFR